MVLCIGFATASLPSFTQYFYRELWGGLHQHLGLYEDPATLALPGRKRVVQVRLASSCFRTGGLCG